MTAVARRFSRPVLAALRAAKILGVRAGTRPHRFVAVWVVTVGDRAFVRSWNDKLDGWRRVFLDDPRGVMQLPSGREVRIRARSTRGVRLLDAIDRAYAEEYPTPGSRQWVRGLRTPRRRATTLELLPR